MSVLNQSETWQKTDAYRLKDKRNKLPKEVKKQAKKIIEAKVKEQLDGLSLGLSMPQLGVSVTES